MKFIKYAVGLVIALSVIPLVVTTVNNLDTQTYTISFNTSDTFMDIDTYDLLLDLIQNDMIDSVSPSSIEYSGSGVDPDFDFSSITYNNDLERINIVYTNTDAEDAIVTIYNNRSIESDASIPVENVDITIQSKTVGVETPPLVKLLVGFVPLLFVGGILLFMLNKRKLS